MEDDSASGRDRDAPGDGIVGKVKYVGEHGKEEGAWKAVIMILR